MNTAELEQVTQELPTEGQSPHPNPSSDLRDALKTGKMELKAPEAVKRKRGRPRKVVEPVVEATPEPSTPLHAEEIAPQLSTVIEMVFDATADARGAHWRISEKEAQNAGTLSASALAAWFPQLSGKQTITAMALATLGLLVFERLKKDFQIKKENAQKLIASAASPAPTS